MRKSAAATNNERDAAGPTNPGQPAPSRAPGRRCGLCGKSTKLIRTECCAQWICNDEANYVMFSYARNSCSRNHQRFTLCGYHCNEQHAGDWRTCKKCPTDFETEMYVCYGTNEYNFAKLENPPAYEPTRYGKCNAVIVLGEGGYSMSGKDYFCGTCSPSPF